MRIPNRASPSSVNRSAPQARVSTRKPPKNSPREERQADRFEPATRRRPRFQLIALKGNNTRTGPKTTLA